MFKVKVIGVLKIKLCDFVLIILVIFLFLNLFIIVLIFVLKVFGILSNEVILWKIMFVFG